MFWCSAYCTSEESEVVDLFEYVETASDWEGAELEAEGLEDSAVSPLGRTPSENHTLLCSRERDPKNKTRKTTLTTLKDYSVTVFLTFVLVKLVPSLPVCFSTPTGTMTVGGGELSTPEACACCRGGMVEQYSAGLLGLGLWLLPVAGVSHDWAARARKHHKKNVWLCIKSTQYENDNVSYLLTWHLKRH